MAPPWNCPICTFENPDDVLICAICATGNKADVPPREIVIVEEEAKAE